MPKRKLTDALRKKIKSQYFKIKESDYTGEALTYLRRVKGAAKARKIKEETTLKIGDIKVPKNSQLYENIESAASMKGQTIKQFMADKKNREAVMLLAKDGGITVDREANYLIEDINKLPKGRKVFWNGKEVSRAYAISLIMEIISYSAQFSNIVMVRFEVRYTLNGDLHIAHVPGREEIDEALEYVDDFDTDEERAAAWEEFLKEFEAINYVKS